MLAYENSETKKINISFLDLKKIKHLCFSIQILSFIDIILNFISLTSCVFFCHLCPGYDEIVLTLIKFKKNG